MTAVPKPKLTPAEYLAIERAAEFKSEFYNGEMFPLHPPEGPPGMAGASYAHTRINDNLVGELHARHPAAPHLALLRRH